MLAGAGWHHAICHLLSFITSAFRQKVGCVASCALHDAIQHTNMHRPRPPLAVLHSCQSLTR